MTPPPEARPATTPNAWSRFRSNGTCAAAGAAAERASAARRIRITARKDRNAPGRSQGAALPSQPDEQADESQHRSDERDDQSARAHFQDEEPAAVVAGELEVERDER